MRKNTKKSSLKEKLALTAIADTRLLFAIEFLYSPQAKQLLKDLLERELRGRLLVPTVVLVEFVEIAGTRIGQEAAKNRIQLLKERGMEVMPLDEEHALMTGSLLLSNRKVPLADAIIASYVKSGEADYVLTDYHRSKP
ncbi:MAG: PIN domain-containing protein [Candidatus Bathyarchaeota archaeon]|nr:PIN domain-containing protein [Candidatus Bathyarchaeota archaeon]